MTQSPYRYRYLKGKCESPSFVWNKDPVISKYLNQEFPMEKLERLHTWKGQILFVESTFRGEKLYPVTFLVAHLNKTE